MPTSAATARAVVSLSPVSRTGRRPSAFSDATASADVSLTVSATTNTAVARPSQPAAMAVCPRASAARRAASSSGGRCIAHSAQQRRPPDDQRVPVDDALDARGPRGWRTPRRRPAGRPRPRPWRWPARSGARRRSRARRPGAAPRSRSTPSATATSTRLILPVVTVPVLSRTTVSTARVDSRTSGPLMSRPSWAPRPVPTISAVGVASPSAHGQAMMSTATAAVNANVALSPVPSQNASVATDRAMTTGTKTPEIRSARRWTGALPVWASSTSRAIWARAVSAPTLVARMTRRPPALTVAPATSEPGRDLDGHRLAGEHAHVDGRASPARRRRRWRPSRPDARRSGRRPRAARRGRGARRRRRRGSRRPWRRAPAAPSGRRPRGAWPWPRSSARRAGRS